MCSRVVTLTLLFCTLAISNCQAQVQNSLWIVNAQRASLRRPLPPYQPNYRLQAQAEAEARAMARKGTYRDRRGRTQFYGHLGGQWDNTRPGEGEGVGFKDLGSDPNGYRFTACLQASSKYKYAGAASAISNGYRFYILKTSNSPR